MRGRVPGVFATGLVASVALLGAVYRADIGAARDRVRGKSTVVRSPYGDIEYTEGGEGPPVLIIHGSAGGYDQGELIVQTVLDDRFHWITPSRFGYLQSTFRNGATFDDQAHAYAWLLDHLGIQRVAVIALSHGGPSALLFALLYPERVSALTLISCGVGPVTTDDQAQADQKGKMLVRIFKYDVLYWMMTKLFKKQLMGLMGATEAVIAGLSPQQLTLIDHFIEYMNPASLRYAGAVFDNTRATPGERTAAIRAPTLIIHAEDDTLQLYDNATFAAAAIPDARLLSFESGGHLVIGIEQAPIRAAVQQHILDNVSAVQPAGL